MPYIENEILERLITTMVEGFARVEKKLDHMNRLKECLDGDKFLDNVLDHHLAQYEEELDEMVRQGTINPR